MTDLLDAQQKIKDFRTRILAGEDIPPEELADALRGLRVAREAALMKKPTSRKKAEKEEDDAAPEAN